ncbi:MAG TPA: Ig-like domain-containing protein [Bacteroidota bacterium]|jgi:hypothetical protein|nr:Ig-like domain-containing protein [Bacteroidota bacterium]
MQRSEFPILLVISLVSTLLFGCRDGITDGSQPNYLDPSIQPVVLYTYPTTGTVGPFLSLYAPGTNYDRPAFYAQFNKAMISKNFVPPCYWCFGFSRPVRISAVYDGPATILFFYIYQLNGVTRNLYEIGHSYTITLDSTLQDVNGNPLSRPFTFTYTPEPYFRVTSSDPADGGVFQYYMPSYNITFNSLINAGILDNIHISPAIDGHWSINYDSLGVRFSPTQSLKPATAYTIQVDGNAMDVDHHLIGTPFTARLSTEAMKIVSTDAFPNFQYLSGSSMASLVAFRCTYPVDTSSALSAITVSPPVPITFVNGERPGFFAANDFAPSTTYQVTISTNLRAYDGTHLASPVSYSFTTDRFRLLLGTFDIYGRIEMFFSGRVTMTSLQSSFSMTPSLGGTFSQDDYPGRDYGGNGPEYWFTPSTPLQRGVQYTVRFNTTLRSVGGYNLAQPDSFQFSF